MNSTEHILGIGWTWKKPSELGPFHTKDESRRAPQTARSLCCGEHRKDCEAEGRCFGIYFSPTTTEMGKSRLQRCVAYEVILRRKE